MSNNKIKIIHNDAIDNEKPWKQIFLMFYETKRSYSTMKDIAEATTKYCQLKRPMSQGTVSKCWDVLSGTIKYNDGWYTVRKFSDDNNEKATYHLIKTDEIEKPWFEGRDKILENEYLVENAVCKVSKFMYVYKLNEKKLQKKKASEEPLKTRRSKIVKEIKEHFCRMILSEYLFDVSYFDGNILVILNSTKPNSSKHYSYYLEHFFDAVQ